jgi:hypothetical protein
MKKEIQPSTNLALSMRDMGYSLETALADVIDNSISAGARTIRVFAPPKVPLTIAILDDGRGMSEDEIEHALTLADAAPEAHRERTDLGRFGLGMKTASWSQCKRLTVVSAVDGTMCGATLDLDVIQQSGKWIADFHSSEDLRSVAYASELGDDGTLILWESLDRLEQSTEDESIRHLASRLSEVESHLELVFHRFLAREPGQKSVSIVVNGRSLEPFDPFNSRHPATQQSATEVIRVGDKGDVKVQAFTLPHHTKITKGENDYYARSEGYLRNQGFYLYRERRLILWGTWFRLIRQHPSLNLSRIRIDIPNTMDEEWRINIMKASAQPPRPVRDRLSRLLETLGGPARRVYERRGYVQTLGTTFPVWSKKTSAGRISYSIDETHPLVSSFRETLDDGQRQVFHSVLQLVSSSLPLDSLFVDLGNSSDQVRSSEVTRQELKTALASVWPELLKVYDAETALDVLIRQEPYRSNEELVEELIAEVSNG